MNKKVLITLIVVSAAILVFLLVGSKKNTIVNFPSSGTSVIAFGDSLVEGVGSTNEHDFVSLLSKKSGVPIINLGVSGNTTRDGIARMNTVNIPDPKVVLLLLGGNDFLRKVPLDETFKNLGDIIENFQGKGAVVILLGVRGGIFSDNYDEHFEKLAEQYGTFYVPDVLDGLLTHNELMSDAIHPNNLGYQKIADKIYPTLVKALGQ